MSVKSANTGIIEYRTRNTGFRTQIFRYFINQKSLILVLKSKNNFFIDSVLIPKYFLYLVSGQYKNLLNMKKLTPVLLAIFIAGNFMISLPGCAKKCGDCPSGQTLVIDNPKENQCYCCPDGTSYDATTGTCQ